MAWAILVFAGVMEAVWATALSDSNNFKKKLPTAIFAVTLPLSLLGLSFAMKDLPTGTSYTVWIAIGTVLTILIAVSRGKETLSTARALILLALVACVVGLKVVS